MAAGRREQAGHTDPFAVLGLKRVINAAGKMTALGGTAQTPEVAGAQFAAALESVDMAELRRVAGERIALRAGAEAATVTSGAAAGIAIGVAALITGDDLDAVRRLPDADGLANEIVLQAGHDVDFGARVSQMVRLGGGQPLLAGAREAVTSADVESLLGRRSAGLLYVQSHHTRQEHGLSLAELVEIGRQRRLPVLVDAAAEEDLARYVEAGADLVTYSGGKAIGGPTVGFIVGRRELIEACELQNRGIARAMKVGKEQISGLLQALQDYPRAVGTGERLERLREGLAALPGCRVSIEADLAGRPIRRVGLRLDGEERLLALVAALKDGDPAIFTRTHLVDQGLLLFDVREVRDDDVELVVVRVRDWLVGTAGSAPPAGH